jgi:CDP-paratose 2-epimerase
MSELTDICRDITDRSVIITEDTHTSDVDIPLYITDYSKASRELGWLPKYGTTEIIREIADWVVSYRASLEYLLA